MLNFDKDLPLGLQPMPDVVAIATAIGQPNLVSPFPNLFLKRGVSRRSRK
jgi:hypothetical protein